MPIFLSRLRSIRKGGLASCLNGVFPSKTSWASWKTTSVTITNPLSGTEEERNQIRAAQQVLWLRIPDPSDTELRQAMGERDWNESEHTRQAILAFYRRQWKRHRKAKAKERLLSNEMWYGRFYISYLDAEQRKRIRAGKFTPEEVEALAKDNDPWERGRYPLPAGLVPPSSEPEESPNSWDVTGWTREAMDWVHAQLRAGKSFKNAEEANAAYIDSQRPAVPGAKADPKPASTKQIRDAKLRQFMPDQIRKEYDKADNDKRKMLWAANEEAFEAAEERKEERLRNQRELTARALDMRQRIQEDPTKAHLLPPENASTQELHEWFREMSKPDRTIPFPVGSGGPTLGETLLRNAAYMEAELDELDRQRKQRQLAAKTPTPEPVTKTRESEPSPSSILNRVAEWIKRNPFWTAAVAFALWQLPLGIAQMWPVLVRDKTIPEWVAERRWPGMTAHVYGWLSVIFFVTLIILGLIMTISRRGETNRDEKRD